MNAMNILPEILLGGRVDGDEDDLVHHGIRNAVVFLLWIFFA